MSCGKGMSGTISHVETLDYDRREWVVDMSVVVGLASLMEDLYIMLLI